jgi:hypothetical protein
MQEVGQRHSGATRTHPTETRTTRHWTSPAISAIDRRRACRMPGRPLGVTRSPRVGAGQTRPAAGGGTTATGGSWSSSHGRTGEPGRRARRSLKRTPLRRHAAAGSARPRELRRRMAVSTRSRRVLGGVWPCRLGLAAPSAYRIAGALLAIAAYTARRRYVPARAAKLQ